MRFEFLERNPAETVNLEARAAEVYAIRDTAHRALTDRLFAVLAVVLWVATLALVFVTEQPERSTLATTVSQIGGLLICGVLFVALPVYCTVRWPGSRVNPYFAAVSLMVSSVLLVRMSGRTDSEFAIFVILAFLAFYRDVRVLALATAIAIGDLILRTVTGKDLFHLTGGGSLSARFEEIAWFLIMDLVLYASISRVSAGLRHGSEEQATLEAQTEAQSETIAQRNQELQESEAVKTIIFEAAPDAVIRYGAGQRIIEINAAGEHMLRLKRDDVIGRSLAEFLQGASPDGIASPAFEEASADHEYVGRFFESIVLRGDGTEFSAECYSAAVPGLETPQCAMFLRDITERKALELQLSQTQKLESIGQLAAGIAHEINTPTQYIGDNTRFLDDAFKDVTNLLDTYQEFEDTAKAASFAGLELDKLDEVKKNADLEFLREEIPKAIRESLEGIDRISTIVRAMKDFSHPGVDGMTSADVNRIVESTATVARNEWKYIADLELVLCPSLPPVICLPGELGQVVLNLIINAAHAITDKNSVSGERGLIRIESSCDDAFVVVKITDSGSGIPERVRARIFDPFFTTKEVGKGTGQGLAIAHNVIVERHGGQLTFETEEGKGTTFVVRLPINQHVESDGAGVAA